MTTDEAEQSLVGLGSFVDLSLLIFECALHGRP